MNAGRFLPCRCHNRTSIAASQHRLNYTSHWHLCQDVLDTLCEAAWSPKLMTPAAVLIKKYGNRRLYDTAGSRYVNLDDLAAMVRAGKEVRVVDAKTGHDLTRVTLTQIITEDAKDRPTGLPLELLRQLIVASDEVRQEFLMWYLKSAFDTYEKLQDAVQNRLSEVQSAILSPVDLMKRFLGSTSSVPQQTDPTSEVEALRKRVGELELELGQSARGRRRSRKKR
jgi:polyhydroxyalkanoate synthesis repressor PhaR